MANAVGLEKGAKVCLAFSAQENKYVRRELYPAYKTNRPERIYEEIRIGGTADAPVLRKHDGVRDLMEIVQCFPSLTLNMPDNDGETDDAMATFSSVVAPLPVRIVTEDRDLWATMSARCHVVSKPGVTYSVSDLEKKFGIRNPAHLPLAKSLYGDDSDNIDKPVPFVTPNSVGALVSACVLQPGERWYTHDFLRRVQENLDAGNQTKLMTNILAAGADILHLEQLTRLRKVRLTYKAGKRDLGRLEALLRWYEINTKFNTIMDFACA